MSQTHIEYNGGCLVSEINELKKENLRLSKINAEYEELIHIFFSISLKN